MGSFILYLLGMLSLFIMMSCIFNLDNKKRLSEKRVEVLSMQLYAVLDELRRLKYSQQDINKLIRPNIPIIDTQLNEQGFYEVPHNDVENA